jgi:hypothetical protein
MYVSIFQMMPSLSNFFIKATISREINYMVPKLAACLQNISWPENVKLSSFGNVAGAVDCSAHPRVRVHPKQADW